MKSKYSLIFSTSLLILVLIITTGCSQDTVYVCTDGSTASSPRACPDYLSQVATNNAPPPQPTYSDCDQFLSESEKRNCMWNIAEITGDMEYCLVRYEDEEMEYVRQQNTNDCLNRMLKRGITTLNDCEYYINNADKEGNCMRMVIVDKGEEALCQLIVNDYHKNSCYKQIARNKEDSSICGSIEDSETKYECIDGVTKVTN